MKQLDQKVGIITGAASGIGQKTAELFAEQGMKVVIADIAAEKGEKVVGGIRKAGGVADFIETDVTKSEQVQHLIRETTERHGALNVLVNDAAYWREDTTIADLTEEVWDKVIDGTLKSVFLCTKYAIPEMIRAGGGSIVNISSVNSVYPVGLTAYSAAKGGVDTLTKIVAVEYGKHKIPGQCCPPGNYRHRSVARRVEGRTRQTGKDHGNVPSGTNRRTGGHRELRAFFRFRPLGFCQRGLPAR